MLLLLGGGLLVIHFLSGWSRAIVDAHVLEILGEVAPPLRLEQLVHCIVKPLLNELVKHSNLLLFLSTLRESSRSAHFADESVESVEASQFFFVVSWLSAVLLALSSAHLLQFLQLFLEFFEQLLFILTLPILLNLRLALHRCNASTRRQRPMIRMLSFHSLLVELLLFDLLGLPHA